MIKDSPEYIEKYGRTNDIIIGIIMFWCLTSGKDRKYNLEYFNEKMDRYLDHQSTEEQMMDYREKLSVSIFDKGNDINSIKRVIDVIVDIYGSDNLDYQLHMYGPSSGDRGSGDWWLESKDELMNQMDKEGGIFSIIASSNGVSLLLAEKVDFLSKDDWKELYTYYNRNHNINKILS